MAVALLTATIMIAHQVAGKATRDALFLSYFDVTQLPKAVVVSAILSVLVVFGMSHWLMRIGPAKLIPRVFFLSAVLFAFEWYVISVNARLASITLYLHMSIFGAILISGFWSLINERFDPHTAKRMITRIAAAATLGGVLGGIATERVTSLIGLPAMLIALSSLHLLCAIGVKRIGMGQRHTEAEQPADLLSGYQVMRKTPYLQRMSLLVVLIALTAALLDYVMKVEVKAHFHDGESLAAFFGLFYAATGVLTFLLQSLLGHRILHRFGLRVSLSILPAVILVGGVVSTAVMQLVTAVVLRGSHMVLGNSLFRTGFELLYTPLGADKKRPTKTLIDVGADRLGDVIGGSLIIGLLAILPDVENSLIVLFAVLSALAALLLIRQLHFGYVNQLGESLRSGAVVLEAEDIIDATTQETMAETNLAIDRNQLLEKIAQLEKPQPTSALSTNSNAQVTEAIALQERDISVVQIMPIIQATEQLLSADPEQIRNVFANEELDYRLIPYVIDLLDKPGVEHDAIQVLRKHALGISGQLVDALLRDDQSMITRRRLPLVLEVCPNLRAAEGLLWGLEDTQFEVRYRCGLALSRILAQAPDIVLDKQRLIAAATSEVELNNDNWTLHGITTGESSDIHLDRHFRHVFTILSIVLDKEVMELSMLALFSHETQLQGTALEYLDHVLPENLRQILWPHLGGATTLVKATRSRKDLIDDLMRSATRIKLDRRKLGLFNPSTK